MWVCICVGCDDTALCCFCFINKEVMWVCMCMYVCNARMFSMFLSHNKLGIITWFKGENVFLVLTLTDCIYAQAYIGKQVNASDVNLTSCALVTSVAYPCGCSDRIAPPLGKLTWEKLRLYNSFFFLLFIFYFAHVPRSSFLLEKVPVSSS